MVKMAAKPEPNVTALPALFERKPMARATRVTLFEREVRERLSGPAIDLLFARAQVLAEGQRAQSPSARDAFFGSIMITIDLDALHGDVREAADGDTAARLAALMSGDARVLRRVRAMAEHEAARLAGARVTVHSADVRVRAEGARVFVDVDVAER
jgi:hypothetical protein